MSLALRTAGCRAGTARQAGVGRSATAVSVAPCRAAVRPSRVACQASIDDAASATQVNRRSSLGLAAAAALLSSGLYTPSNASAALSPTEDTAAKFFKLLVAKDPADDAVLDLVASSVVLAPSWPGAPLLKGKDGVKQYLTRHRATLSYISGKPPTFVAQGDSVVAFPTATYLVKSSKRTFTYTSAAVFKFNKEGRITSISEFADTLTLDKEGVVWKK